MDLRLTLLSLTSTVPIRFWLVAVCVLGTHGCGVGVVRDVSLDSGQTPALGQTVIFTIRGGGQCDTARVDWGDGATEDVTKVVLDSGHPVSHVYSGWGGGKTITVFGTAGCEGTARTRINIPPPTMSIGFAAGPNACDPVPNRPALAPRTLVHIKTIPVTGPYSFGIDFGCPLHSCRHDADGKVGTPAPSSYPFPGLTAFSLVLRVGTQVFQGGKDVQFTSSQAAPLEICLNDDSLNNNSGGYEIDVSVDQLGPVIP